MRALVGCGSWEGLGRDCLFPGGPRLGTALWCHLEDVAWAGLAGTGPGRGRGHGAQWGAAPQLLPGPERRVESPGEHEPSIV